jgi:hypothetical protein
MRLPPGTIAARSLFARSKALLSGDPASAPQIAAGMFGERDASVGLTKAAVSAGSTSNDFAGLVDHSDETAALVAEATDLSLVGRMQGIVRVEPTTPYMSVTQRATAGWAGEGKAIRVSPLAIGRETVGKAKIAAVVVLTAELLADASPLAVEAVRAMIASATQRAIDDAFADAANAGTAGEKPASVCYGAKTVASLGSFEGDAAQLADGYTGSWPTAFMMLHPADAVRVAIMLGGRGLGGGIGAKGGDVAGIVTLCSESVPRNQLAIVDASAIAMVDLGTEIAITRDATLELDSTPTGSTMTPTAASQNRVSLWQADAVAIRITRRISWEVTGAADGRVVTCSTDYLSS